MSNKSEASRRRHQHVTTADAPFTGIPLWSSLSIVAAALITGLLLAVSGGELGWVYLALFTIAAIVTALLTEPRGLFILVVSLPLLYSAVTVATGLGIVANSPGEGNGLSTTEIITGIYPLLQHFPVLFIVTAVAAFIAIVRIYLLKRNARLQAKNAHKVRVKDIATQQRNQATYSKSRNLAGRASGRSSAGLRRSRNAAPTAVTVDQLASRRRPRTRQPEDVPSRNRSTEPQDIRDQDRNGWTIDRDKLKKDPERNEKPWMQSLNDDLYS